MVCERKPPSAAMPTWTRRTASVVTEPFITALQEQAFALSQLCADTLNRHRDALQRLEAEFRALPDDIRAKHIEPQKMCDFLALYCNDDGRIAQPLPPRAALLLLRREPTREEQMRFKTHSYHSNAMIDMLADDCRDFLLMQLGEFCTANMLAIRYPQPIHKEMVIIKESLGFQYDTFVTSLGDDILCLIASAKALRNACARERNLGRHV